MGRSLKVMLRYPVVVYSMFFNKTLGGERCDQGTGDEYHRPFKRTPLN